jgi:ABC-type Na+ efflux pump permease subunit
LSLLARDAKTGALQQAKKKDEVAEFVAPFGMVMLLTMIVMVGTAPMLSAVTEAKNQRIFEMLLGLATPMELMAARVLAALGRSLTSSAFYIVGALLVLEGMAMMGSVPLYLLPWFFVYLVADVIMLSSFAAALGAACNSPQDAQNLAVVLVAPIMIPFFVMMPVMTAPNGAMATVMSLFPPFTPVVMLLGRTGGCPGVDRRRNVGGRAYFPRGHLDAGSAAQALRDRPLGVGRVAIRVSGRAVCRWRIPTWRCAPPRTAPPPD